MSLGKKIRGGFAALLSASLILSGALLVAPAASAVEATPVVTPALVAASEAGLEVKIDFTNVTIPEGRVGVYVALVETGTTAAVGRGAFVDSALIADGAGSGTYVAAKTGLDRSKTYQALVWYAHGAITTESIVARADIAVSPESWDLVFPPATPAPGTEADGSDIPGESTETSDAELPGETNNNPMPDGTATVTVASETGLTVRTELTGVNAASLPAGVHVGLVLRGTAIGSVTGDFIAVGSVPNPLNLDGTLSYDLPVAVDKLDRSAEYEIVVWPRRTNPVASNVVVVLPFDVDEAQWDAVFPAAGPSLSADISLADENGIELVARVAGLDPLALPNGVHVGVIPAGMATTAVTADFLAVGSMRPADMPVSGEFDLALMLDASKLDRTKSYELLVWKRHTTPSVASNLALSPLTVSESEWEKVFPSGDGVRATVGKVVSGESIQIHVTASGLPVRNERVYVGFFEKPAVGSGSLAIDSEAQLVDGALGTTLSLPASKLNRTKSYEVVIWKSRTVLSSGDYGHADVLISSPQWDDLFATPIKPTPFPQPAPGPAPEPASQSAGSLTWGISTSFARYVTGDVASGTITTSGVGGGRGGYVFPQASGGSWNAQTQTGSIPFSGVVTFSGHKGALSRTVSNPVITVTSATSATISVSGQPFATLNLAAGSKSVGANGEITWSGVPVSGGFGYGSYDLAADPLTFTVGAVSGATFGSTSVTAPVNIQRTAAPAPPATSGVRVITQSNELVAGGEIEFEASGFQPGERGILVVMYSEPTVLDTNAGADANGVVRWIGTLPDDLTGEHTITLQGSINVGKVITIAAAEPVKKSAFNTSEVEDAQITEVQAAGVSDSDGPGWVIWASALALLVVAGGLTALVVSQRRRAGGGTL
ncbi:HtaA domain-containing protein [Leucobacter sp. Z1108]|uniref:HtaA domain-containing protein n=1 Tax=Leucobacter sp. Z1108 TaxID=3439066 RepID=UPI003F349D68